MDVGYRLRLDRSAHLFYLVLSCTGYFVAYFFGLVSGLLLLKCEEYPMYV